MESDAVTVLIQRNTSLCSIVYLNDLECIYM